MKFKTSIWSVPLLFNLAAGVLLGAVSKTLFEPLPEKFPGTKDNPITPAKVELGKQLYFDPILSRDGTVSCNSCHNVMGNGTDNRRFSQGVAGKLGGRNSPTVWNAVFHSVQFWDGRAPTLVDQAKGPLLNPIEMAMPSPQAVVDRVNAIPGYREAFRKVFGEKDPVTFDNIAQAIAAYETTLITPNSPFDRYLKGDEKALTPQQVRGMNTFAQVGCVTCHSGLNFSGPSRPTGEGNFMRFPINPQAPQVKQYDLMKDPGRFEFTRQEADRFLWRVPTLRNVELTAPYFHNGSVDSLEDAVQVMTHTQLAGPLSDQQVRDLVAFLSSLTGQFPQQTMPRLPPSPSRAVLVNTVEEAEEKPRE